MSTSLAASQTAKHSCMCQNKMVSETEKAAIEVSLEKTKGNQIKAAKILGINRNTLKSKMEKYKIGVSK